jgi:hypothetical protein
MMNTCTRRCIDLSCEGSTAVLDADDRAEACASLAGRQRHRHPTRRHDGRTPNPRAAEAAIAAAMGVPLRALRSLALSRKSPIRREKTKAH